MSVKTKVRAMQEYVPIQLEVIHVVLVLMVSKEMPLDLKDVKVCSSSTVINF